MDSDFDPATLSYPFDFRPGDGEAREVLPGLHWVRMPLPMALRHINTWLLDDGDGHTVVDTGITGGTTRERWTQVLEVRGGGPLRRVVCTHLHPDHAGSAGWLVERHGAEFWMTRGEYLTFRLLVADQGEAVRGAAARFYRAAGFDDEALARHEGHFGLFARLVDPLPASFRRLQDGQVLSLGGRRWEVVVGRGHSPEHACLYCAEAGVLISGDQVLPTISSNVSVYPTEPEANPLAEWLDSLRHLRARLPADVLVLPAHGRPFRGIRPRLDALIDDHLEGLDRLRAQLARPHRAVDVFDALFSSRIDEGNRVMATGEAVAHLNYLRFRGEAVRERDGDGVDWYGLA